MSLKIAFRALFATLFANRFTSVEIDELKDDFTVLFDGVFVRSLLPGPIKKLSLPLNIRYRRARNRLMESSIAPSRPPKDRSGRHGPSVHADRRSGGGRRPPVHALSLSFNL
ncbi:hypothetical protein [Lentzea jiangxiensis]|uniref:hypothetical protein n=1 Tax=Lentzea jiangxiensis TaxID=641025 RepID=UPI00115FD29D|nr:hypothetical protein [Lentzea jiangxiensis]